MTLTKEQEDAIKAVGAACGGFRPIKKYVFSDGASVYGTNGQILLIERGVYAPAGAYFPHEATSADIALKMVGCSAGNFIEMLHKYDKPSVQIGIYSNAKNAFDVELRNEIYQIDFAVGGCLCHRKKFFLKRLIDKAIKFVDKGFSLYQNELNSACIFESLNVHRSRRAFVITYHDVNPSYLKIFNDVDLKGSHKTNEGTCR